MTAQILTLCYHAVADLSGDPILAEYGVVPHRFEAHLDGLLAQGFTFVAPDDLLGLISGSGKIPEKAVLLTFDDCYEELVRVAQTILKPRDIKAIAFAVSGVASGTNEWDQKIGARRLRLLDSKGLHELSEAGVEIGSHSRSHVCLPTLSGPALEQETRLAADDIEAMGLPRPRFFAYPHGEHDARARSAVRKAGFAAAFGLKRDRVGARSDRFALPRIEVLARDIGWRFAVKTRWPELAPIFSPLPLHKRLVYAGMRTVRRLRRPGSATD